MQKSTVIDDDDDDWSDFETVREKTEKENTRFLYLINFFFQLKKSTAVIATATTLVKKRQDDFNDDSDQDDKWSRTGGSNAAYFPSFGGTSNR